MLIHSARKVTLFFRITQTFSKKNQNLPHFSTTTQHYTTLPNTTPHYPTLPNTTPQTLKYVKLTFSTFLYTLALPLPKGYTTFKHQKHTKV